MPALDGFGKGTPPALQRAASFLCFHMVERVGGALIILYYNGGSNQTHERPSVIS